ncbi:MAG TPA: CoA-transferase [Intrasporangium sp.]|uniref:CoA-transferase n=1 Tax=Intrasporangium sp. TaxID=1925024 RepID=UPI002D76A43F|nr:CoA-transferase [Intrasporangium sp.]HET7398248.1 CoA-transferase [Intrasporangium sp.]
MSQNVGRPRVGRATAGADGGKRVAPHSADAVVGPVECSSTTRFVSAADAASSIADGATVALTGSGGGILEPDGVLAAIEERFLATGHPRGLTVIHGLGIGDGATTGLNRLAHQGLVSCVVGGHWSWSPRMQQLVKDELIEGYALPTGVISALLRESGAGRPGVITKVGLGTFIDPRVGGPGLNRRSTRTLVSTIDLDGVEYLHYKPFRVDVGIVRGSSVDTLGNLSAAAEPAILDSLAVAAAARGNGGFTIAQAKEQVPAGTQDPRTVSVPAPLVSLAVIRPEQWQSYLAESDPALTENAVVSPRVGKPAVGPVAARELVARRAAEEVPDGAVLNVGFGMSAGVVDVLAQGGRLDRMRIVIEQGPVGGHPESGALFGLSRHPDGLLASTSMFDLFATGMIDVAVLGMAEADRHGNVNVSKVGDSVVGPGGFIDISTSARKLVFCGTFTAGGLQASGDGGELTITAEGRARKFVQDVSHITFSAERARERGQEVVFVTERAVLRLGPRGLVLTEIADGIDLERDVLAQMDFVPDVDGPRLMNPEIFASPLIALS